MNKLIDEFITNLNAGDIWIGFLALAIYYILKKQPFIIFSYLSDRKSKDIDQAKILLECDSLSKESKELIKEHIENYAFNKYYGIDANNEMRTALVSFYEKYKNNIGWHNLKRAYDYIEINGSNIFIRLTLKNHIGRWFVTGLCSITGLYSLAMILLAFLSRSENQTQFFVLSSLSLVLLCTSLFFSIINWPYHSAKKINHLINKDNTLLVTIEK